MTTPTRRRGGVTEHHHETPHQLPVSALRRTAADLNHISNLAALGLDGTEPGDGLDLLFEAQDMLARDLAPLRHLRRRSDA